MPEDRLLAHARQLLEESAFDLATHRKPFVTAGALAEYLDCDRRTIVRMIQTDSLPGVKVGRSWRIPTDAARARFHVEQKQAS